MIHFPTLMVFAAILTGCGMEVEPILAGAPDRPVVLDSVSGDSVLAHHPTLPDSVGTQPPPVTPIPVAGLRFIDSTRIAAWRQMRNSNHVLWQTALATNANTGTGTERYGDSGLWSAIVALVNDDSVAARKAIGKLKQMSVAPADNERREYATENMIKRDMIARWLTDADRHIVDTLLARWAASTMAGIPTGDSDELTGAGCAVLLHDLYFGTTYTSRSAGVPFGGMTVTGQNRATVINALGDYVRRANGGDWIESTEYNPGTLALLAMCNQGARVALGRDVVPGVSQLLHDGGRLGAMMITPDLRQSIQWGDEENPRDLKLYRRATFLSASPAPEAQWMLSELIRVHWRFSAEQLMARALLLSNPSVAPVALPNDAVHVAPGLGTLYHRHGTSLGFAMAMNQTGVHHTQTMAPFDAQVYREGEWVLTHPISYSAPDDLIPNTPVYAGLSTFGTQRMTWSDVGTGWSAIAGVTSGGFTVTQYPHPPPFLRYGGRVTVLAQVDGFDVVITRDSVDMVDPRSLTNYSAGYRQTGQYPHQQRVTDYEGKMWALWHAPVQPIQTGATLSWSTPGGQTVELTPFAAQPVQVVIVSEATLGWQGLRPSEQNKWHARTHSDAPVLWSVVVMGRGTLPVSRSGDTITVGSRAFTITSAGVTVQ